MAGYGGDVELAGDRRRLKLRRFAREGTVAANADASLVSPCVITSNARLARFGIIVDV